MNALPPKVPPPHLQRLVLTTLCAGAVVVVGASWLPQVTARVAPSVLIASLVVGALAQLTRRRQLSLSAFAVTLAVGLVMRLPTLVREGPGEMQTAAEGLSAAGALAEPHGLPYAVAQFDVEDEDDAQRVSRAIRLSGADLITLRGMAPSLSASLRATFRRDYRHQFHYSGRGGRGLTVLSRMPFVGVDTVVVDGLIQWSGTRADRTDTRVVSVEAVVPAGAAAQPYVLEHVRRIAEAVRQFAGATIMLTEVDGEGAARAELLNLRRYLGLQHSRLRQLGRFVNVSPRESSTSNFAIYNSPGLACTAYREWAAGGGPRGVTAEFRLKPSNH